MGLLKNLLRAAVTEFAGNATVPAQTAPPPGVLTLERMHNAISIELHEHLRAIRDLVEEIRELRRYCERVCATEAQLTEDLRQALRPFPNEVRAFNLFRRGQQTAPAEAEKPQESALGAGDNGAASVV